MKPKAGDVVLVEGDGIGATLIKVGNFWTRLLGYKDPIKYTHAGIMVSDREIVEAIDDGVVMHDFPYKKNFAIYRHKYLTIPEIDKIKRTALKQVGDKYDHGLLIVIGILKILRLEDKIKLGSRKDRICSLVVAKCYEKIKYNFRSEEDIELVDPADIAEKILFRDAFSWIRVV